uniref:ATP synthase subunit a n=1 Tax=Yuukianura szeptyckii TaxID=1453868 RepID=A0A7T0M4V1_9HEXA|nr:ATP synthase F0 subunit 6 [Yuukianura szeptyckii]QPL15824.1 ATP synthase F0 subunit 6 [Yuukianura szeptyckii]
MMSSLFSSFDPCSTSSFLPFNWISSLIILFLIPLQYWFISNRLNMLFSLMIQTLHKELKLLISSSFMNGSTILFISILLMIMFNNFMGLFPYIFTSSSHLVMALSLAAPLWLTFMFFGWIFNSKHMFAHLVPLSTPNLLMPFMVLIESISNVIRPGTLTVRLSANMIAGHLLLTLLGNQTSHSSNFFPLIFLLIIQVALLLLESAVAIIQAYVFTVLSTLYSNEVK